MCPSVSISSASVLEGGHSLSIDVVQLFLVCKLRKGGVLL